MLTLLTGKRVREAETVNEELLLAMSHPLPKAASLLPTIPPAVADVIDRALAFDKKLRWPTARVMQDAVRAAEMSLAGRENDTLAAPSGRPAPMMPVAITPRSGAPAGPQQQAAVPCIRAKGCRSRTELFFIGCDIVLRHFLRWI